MAYTFEEDDEVEDLYRLLEIVVQNHPNVKGKLKLNFKKNNFF